MKVARQCSVSIEILWLGGACPVQAHGTVGRWNEPKRHFYFRARGNAWRFTIADTEEEAVRPRGDTQFDHAAKVPRSRDVFLREAEWGDTVFAAGYMPQSFALAIIARCVNQYEGLLERRWQKAHPQPDLVLALAEAAAFAQIMNLPQVEMPSVPE